MNQHFIPEDRLQQLLQDLLGASPSTHTLSQMSLKAAETLKPYQDQVLKNLKAASVKHLDETGLRVSAKTQWLHVISHEALTHYRVSSKRKDLEPLEGISGTTVHDHYSKRV